jgi:hypothetical protein
LLKPDLVGAKAGDSLQVQEDDLISWNNETKQPFQPWPTDNQYKPLPASVVNPPPPPPPAAPHTTLYLSDMIPGNLSSTPAYNAVMPAAGNIVYYCLLDANGNATKVCGQIIVSAIPQALSVPSIGS